MRPQVLLIVICCHLLTPFGFAGLLAKWSFEEASGPVVDSVSSVSGVLNNVSRVPGVSGQALHFNGTNSYVYVGAIGSNLDLKGRPYTFSWWQNWVGPNARYQEVFAMEDGNDYSGGYSVFLLDPTLNQVHNNGPDQHWPITTVTPNIWQHIAITFDGLTRNAYLNGVMVGAKSTSGYLSSDGDDPLVFGAVNAFKGLANFYAGDLDEFRIYDKALSAQEIKALSSNSSLEIIEQPSSQKADVATPIQLRVSAISSQGVLQYQWKLNGNEVSGATNATYQFGPNESPGIYNLQVRVSDTTGAILESEVARIQVVSVLVPGLLASWNFDEESGDLIQDSELRFPGTLYNVERVSGHSGLNTDRGLHFNGTNAYAFVGAIGSDLELLSGSYTISWWQRWNGSTGHIQEIVSMDDGADFSGGYAAYISALGQIILLHNTGNGSVPPIASNLFVTNKWQQFAVTYDGDERSLYINGSLIAQNSDTPPLRSDSDDALIFGALNAPCCGGLVNYYSGDLDEVSIYNRALTQEELLSLGPPPEIEILAQPASWNVGMDVNVNMVIKAIVYGGLELRYQWTLNDVDIPGATNASMAVSVPQKGTYKYQVRLTAGELEKLSDPATLNVVQNTQPGLIAHWAFDGTNAVDLLDSAGSYNGQVEGAQSILGRVGTGALRFNSPAAYAKVEWGDTTLQLVGTPYSICWWMLLNPNAATKTILDMQDRNQKLGWFIDANLSSIISGHGSSTWSSSTGVATTNWNHFALVWDGQRRFLYVNGALRNSILTVNNIATHGNTPLYIGNRSGLNLNMNGSLDDIRIYNYALASTEVNDLIVPPLPPRLRTEGNYSDGVKISWENPWTNSYRLELSETISGPWSPTAFLPLKTGTTNSVTVPMDRPFQFYRLREL